MYKSIPKTSVEKFLLFFGAALLAVAVVSPMTGCGPKLKVSSLDGSIDLHGHRGARGLRPENTIPAFIFCMENKMTTIELDTNLTKDKQLIVYHDSKLNNVLCLDSNKKSPQARFIKDMTVAQLKELDCGSVADEKFPTQVPAKNTHLITLPEFFDFVKKYEAEYNIKKPHEFNIEIKLRDGYTKQEADDAVKAMAAAVNAAGVAERTIVQSFVLDVLPEIKKLVPGVRTSFLFKFAPNKYVTYLKLTLGMDADRYDQLDRAVKAGVDIVSPYHGYVDSEYAAACHKKNIQIIPWTVNNAKAVKMLLNCGVDGIISDYPDMLYREYWVWQENQPEGTP